MLVLNNTKASIKLNLLAQQAVYKSFSFKKLRGCDTRLRFSKLSVSFKQKLFLQSLFSYNYYNTNSWVLATCKVLEVRSSFLLLGTGQKYTQLQPKFKVAFSGLTGLVNKDLLFGSFDITVFSFLKFSRLVSILRPFWYVLVSNAFLGRTTSSIWQALLVCKQEVFFFYATLFSPSLSNLQKKINFVQFNTFLKSVHIPLAHK